jgi:SAM-dependent methyltransferase
MADVEAEIAVYLRAKGYPDRLVRNMLRRHRFKGIRAARLLSSRMRSAHPTVLNLGCGSGMNHACILSELRQATVYGLDVDARAVELCRRYNPRGGENISLYDGRAIPFANEFFDGIICDTVIEHVADPLLLLHEAQRVLKSYGALYITTANRLWPIEPHYHLPCLALLPKTLARKYMRLFGMGQGYDDINLPTYRAFMNLLRRAGFDAEDVTFEVLARPEAYEADTERPSLKILRPVGFACAALPEILRSFLQNFNIGWIVIGHRRASAD